MNQNHRRNGKNKVHVGGYAINTYPYPPPATVSAPLLTSTRKLYLITIVIARPHKCLDIKNENVIFVVDQQCNNLHLFMCIHSDYLYCSVKFVRLFLFICHAKFFIIATVQNTL